MDFIIYFDTTLSLVSSTNKSKPVISTPCMHKRSIMICYKQRKASTLILIIKSQRNVHRYFFGAPPLLFLYTI
jgi:hypothetical protein